MEDQLGFMTREYSERRVEISYPCKDDKGKKATAILMPIILQNVCVDLLPLCTMCLLEGIYCPSLPFRGLFPFSFIKEVNELFCSIL